MKVPVNTLYPTPLTSVTEWSAGRWRIFARCRREFCFHYLAARGGWDAEMPEILQQLYRLKHLVTAEEVSLEILNNTVRELSAIDWHCRSDRYSAAFLRHGFRAVASYIGELANRSFYHDPAGKLGLQELELDGCDFDTAVQKLHDIFSRWADLFLAGYGEELSAVGTEEWLRTVPVLQFTYGGVNIYLRSDPVWMRNGNAVWLNLSFDASAAVHRTGSDEWRRYWIYSNYKTDPGRINILFYDVSAGKTLCRDITDFDFTATRELMYKEAAIMREWVCEAVSSGFDVMESMPEPDTKCGKCRFREFCRRHGSVNI